MSTLKVGFAICGSFCTFSKVFPCIEALKEMGASVTPIMSEIAYSTDTRFGKASEHCEKIAALCGKEIIHTIVMAEPIGPQNMFDILIIAPCTGNTLGKMAHGITDSAVTMAAKSQLRNSLPVLIAVSTNDALGTSAKNIATLMNKKNVYFVPMKQDDPDKKPNSMVADFDLIIPAVREALVGKQIQPVIQ